MADRGVELWISSLAASRAKTCPLPDQERVSMENEVVSGGTMPESSLKLDLQPCSSKTCQVCSREADRDFDAYAAGLIDGEGSLTIRADVDHSSCTVVMQITMATKAVQVLNAIYRSYGGSIRPIDGRRPGESSTVKWQMSGKKLLCVLRRIRPFINLKREQLDICIELMEMKWPEYNGNMKVTPERLVAFQKAKDRVEELNQRGPIDTLPGYVAQLVGNRWMTKKVSLFGEHWETFSGRFPASGSLRNGVVFERPTLELRTGEKEYSSWPTARAEGSECCGNHPGAQDSLLGATRDWRTPNTRDHHAQGPRLDADQRQVCLVDRAVEFWKTPHGMANMDASGKHGGAGGGEFAKQANNWTTPQAHDSGGAVLKESGAKEPSTDAPTSQMT
jgi:hypothetical protein